MDLTLLYHYAMHLAPSIDVVDFPRVGVIDAPPVGVVDSPPDGGDVYEQLSAYFAKNCYADTWALASRTEVSLKWTDIKDFYSNNPQELKKYTAISGIVRMCCSYSCDELFSDVCEGIIQSYLIGYSIVNGADHRDIGMDADLGVGENFIKSWADFLHTHFYTDIALELPFEGNGNLLEVIHKYLGSHSNGFWLALIE